MSPRIQPIEIHDEMMIATDLAAQWGAEDGAAGIMQSIPLLSPGAHGAYMEAFWVAMAAAQQMRAHVGRRAGRVVAY